MNNLFWLTFSCIKGVGNISVKELYYQHPYTNFELVQNPLFLETIKPSIRKFLDVDLLQEGKEKALNIIDNHEKKNISVIPINSEYYPSALRFIKDPPAIIYAKGNIKLLKNMDMVAIVGTREPTSMGEHAGRRIASTFVEYGYTIVSGLALGIDTAGHEGALRIENGKTIAVMAGDLTQVYPAKNKLLAQEILNKNGLLISETPIGQVNTRGNFVKRDRIQSGISLGVCPVQTPIKSGTQHTIKYAREQGRLLFTPQIMEIDRNENAIQGNLELLKNPNVIILEDKNSYSLIIQKLNEIKKAILNEEKKFINKEIPTYKENKHYEQESLF